MPEKSNGWVMIEDQEPPKDGNPFLAWIQGYPWAVMLAWSSYNEEFCWPHLQACSMKGGADDVYFENEWINKKEVLAWQPLPEVPHK